MDLAYQEKIGFIYDVCQVIICKTAKRESWINVFVMNGQEEQDVQRIDQTLKEFSAVDQRWNILTSIHPKKGILLSKLYIEFLQNTICSENEMDFEKYISTPNLLRSRICDWYFESADISNLECFNKLLQNSDLEDSIRLKLYEFITLPDEYIRTINKSMQNVLVEMEEYYRKNDKVIEKRKNDFKYFEIQQEKLLFLNTSTWEQKINHCIISFSLINRYTGMRDECSKEGYGWILLGIDYDTEVEKLEEPLSLTGFGHALSDTTRLNILREIHQNGEQTLTDLSKTFDLANAGMLYHLDILRQERLLGQRHEGRRVYYWLNYSQLSRAILAILSEFGGELNENMEKAFFGNSKP